jgi:hypothetical protein
MIKNRHGCSTHPYKPLRDARINPTQSALLKAAPTFPHSPQVGAAVLPPSPRSEFPVSYVS